MPDSSYYKRDFVHVLFLLYEICRHWTWAPVFSVLVLTIVALFRFLKREKGWAKVLTGQFDGREIRFAGRLSATHIQLSTISTLHNVIFIIIEKLRIYVSTHYDEIQVLKLLLF